MTSNVTRTNNGKRLMAVIAVLALIACAFVAFVPTADAADPSASNVVNVDASVTVPAEGGNYYVSAENTADAAIAINAGSVTGTNVVNIFMKNGADITLSTGTGGVVNIYIATGEWTRTTPADGTTNIVGTVTYNASTLVTAANNIGTAEAITATEYGFSVASSATIITLDSYVNYTPSTGSPVQILNAQVVDDVGGFPLGSGGSLTIPADTEIPGNFTVSNGTTVNDVYTPQNILSFQTGTVPEVASPTVIPEHQAFVTDENTGIDIENDSSTGALTVNEASWVYGTITMTEGTADIGAAIEFPEHGLVAVANGNIAAGAGTIYSEITDYITEGTVFNGSIVLFGDKTYTADITLNSTYSEAFRVADSTFEGTFTWIDSTTDSTNNHTYAVDVVATATGNSGSIVSGSSGEMAFTGTINSTETGSSLVIEGISVDVGESTTDAAGITMSEVAFGEDVVVNVPITITDGGKSIIPYESTVNFEGNGAITLSEGTATNVALIVLGELRASNYTDRITGTGTVEALDAETVRYFTATGIKVNSVGTQYFDVSTAADAAIEYLQNAKPGMTVGLYTSGASDVTFDISGIDLELEGVTIIVYGDKETVPLASEITTTNGVDIVIGGTSAASVTLTDSTIDSDGANLYVRNGSTLDIYDSILYIAVQADSDDLITVDNEDVTYINTSSEVRVGYGTTLELDGNVSSIFDVYGDLIISNTATIPYNTTMDVYPGASVTVDGTLTILGTANFMEGSEGIVNGTVTVGNSDGRAILNVDGDFTVNENATLTVVGIDSDKPNKNKLYAPEEAYQANADNKNKVEYAYKFTVLGTLNMNGAMSGYVHNMGTMTFNGYVQPETTSTITTVVVYDGITFTANSVNGSLRITDLGIADEYDISDYVFTSTGNIITLKNVRNVAVSVALTQFSWVVDPQNYLGYYSTMSVSGDVLAISGSTNPSVSTSANGTYLASIGGDDKYVGGTVVAADTTLSFGPKVEFTVGAALTIDGTVDFLEVGNEDDKAMTGAGPVTVNGELNVTSSDAITFNVTNINAARYTVTTTGTEGTVTITYTNFADAIEAAPNADDDLVTILGTVKVAENVTIPSGVTVNMVRNSSLNIGSDAEVILSTGAKMTGSGNTTIDVDGTFTAQNTPDMEIRNVIADVVIVNEPATTWTSLANAIGMGETDITLNGPITIEEDTTIPEGVTVNSEYDVTVDDATLSVEGSLVMDGGVIDTINDGKVTADGSVSVKVLLASNPTEADTGLAGIAGAHYGLLSGASVTYYVSSMAIAAENTNGAQLHKSVITVVGSISAGDVEFTAATNYPYTIGLAEGASNDAQTFLSMGTLSLNGPITFAVPNAYASFTGSVSAPYGDGTSDAQVDMNRASGIILRAYSTLGVTTTYTLAAYSPTGYTGDVDVAAGTVSIGYDTTNNKLTVGASGSTEKGTLDVLSGATISIANNMQLVIVADETVDIAGTINVANDDAITGASAVISGTMNVNVAFNTENVLYITGTVNVADDYVMTVDQKMVVGAAPESLGVGGALAGDYRISGTGYILAYAGADLSGAQINWNTALNQSDAQTTTYVINGVEYATVYAVGNVGINDIFGTANNQEEIDLSGLVTSNYTWYTTEDATTAASGYIGNYETVYKTLAADSIRGTVTNGAGIDIFIDGALFYSTNTDGSANASLTVGTHKISYEIRAGWDGSNVVLTYNGQTIQNGDTITVTADMTSFTLSATGAINSTGTSDSGSTTGGDDGLGLTDYLLIVLVVLIVVMAIIVAIRLMRS